MSDRDPETFIYDPGEAGDQFFKPGATTGYVVLWSGEPGPAHVAAAVAFADEDGQSFVEQTSEFEPTTIVEGS